MNPALATLNPSQTIFAPPSYYVPQPSASGYAPSPAAAQDNVQFPSIISDKTCLQVYNELKKKQLDPFLRSPVLVDERTTTIGDLFSVAVTHNCVQEADAILESPGMQRLFEANTIINPHNLIVVDTSGNIYSLLRFASLFGSTTILKTLYLAKTVGQRVFNVNAVDFQNYTPLESVLLDYGSSRKQKIETLFQIPSLEVSKTRPFALENAIRMGAWGMNPQNQSGRDESAVEMLLEKGVDVDIFGGVFGTCLEAACFFSTSDMIYKLISRSSSKAKTLNTGGAKYGSVLQAASCLGRLDVVSHLVKLPETEVNQVGGVYGCALAAAAKGPYANPEDPYTWNPVTKDILASLAIPMSSAPRFLKIVEELLNRGAVINCQGGIFYNPLEAAIKSSMPQILEALLNHDEKSQDWNGNMYSEALTQAAFLPPTQDSSLSMVELLVASGKADPNFRSSRHLESGWTPLEAATIVGNVDSVRCLLRNHADPKMQGGQTGGPLRSAILTSGQHRLESQIIAGLLIEQLNVSSASFTAEDSQYCNILHLAIYYELWDVASLLLSKGVDYKVKDSGKRTVLHVATVRGSPYMVKLLLDLISLNGGILEAEDAWGKTALQIAEEESKRAQELLETARKQNALQMSYYAPDTTSNWQALNFAASQWADILRIFEQHDLTDLERQNDRGGWIMGPGTKKEATDTRLARPVVTTLSRFSGSRFQATIVDFSIVDDLEFHKVRTPLIDEVLYISSLQDIMTRGSTSRTAIPYTTPTSNESINFFKNSSGQQEPQVNPKLAQTNSEPRLRWIHLPANNMAWVEDLMINIRNRQPNLEPPLGRDLWGSDGLHSTSSHSAPHTYSITPQCKLLSLGNPAHRRVAITGTREDPGTKSPATEPDGSRQNSQIFLCLPYIHWETVQGQDKTRQVLAKGASNSDADPWDDLLCKFVINNANNHPPLHIRRTLDQYYYAKLRDTRDRDKDQVVNRARDENLKFRHLAKPGSDFSNWINQRDEQEGMILKTKDPGVDREYELEASYLTAAVTELDKLDRKISKSLSGVKDDDIEVSLQASMRDSPIIMVDQLWLWVLENGTVVSSFSPRRRGWSKTDVDPKNSTDILKSISKHLRTTTRTLILSDKDLISLIVSQCLGILLDQKTRHDELDFLTTFSTRTASVLDKTSKLLNMFVKSFEQYGSQSEVPGGVFEIMFSVTKETLLFREVQDLRDELGMLSALFQEQSDVLADAEKLLYPDESAKKEATALGLSRAGVLRHQKDVARMQGQAVQTYEMLKDLLDLKQQQANVLEARQSRKQAVIAAKQGKVVLVFTVVTIIFLPLTFMTTVFTLNVSTFPKKVEPATDVLQASTTLSGIYVFPIIVGVTVAMAVPLIYIAFNVDMISAWFARTALYKRFFEDELEE